MDKKMALGATVIMVLVVCSAAFLQSVSATEANPDWVFIKTITGQGTENQLIDVDVFVPYGYHWGVRGRYTATGTASLALYYAGCNPQDYIDGEKGVRTYIVNIDPSRSRDHGQGPLKVTAVNTISYELNFYYDANLGNQTQSTTPTASPTPTPRSNQAFLSNQSTGLLAVVVIMVVALVVVTAVAAILLVKRKTVLRGSK
jgi:hypothetical protein